MILLVPMAGVDKAFIQKGHAYGKSLSEIDGKPLIQHVWESLEELHPSKVVFVIRKKDAENHSLDHVLKLMVPGCSVVYSEGLTGGAACTVLLAIEHIEPERELVVVNGDQIIQADLPGIIEKFRESELDAGVIIFDSIHPRWSFVRLDREGMVAEAAEKRPISRWATAGFFYFRRGKEFVDATMEMIRKDAHTNGQFYVCPALNQMILKHRKIGAQKIPRKAYRSLATPKNVDQFEAELSGGKGGNT